MVTGVVTVAVVVTAGKVVVEVTAGSVDVTAGNVVVVVSGGEATVVVTVFVTGGRYCIPPLTNCVVVTGGAVVVITAVVVIGSCETVAVFVIVLAGGVMVDTTVIGRVTVSAGNVSVLGGSVVVAVTVTVLVLTLLLLCTTTIEAPTSATTATAITRGVNHLVSLILSHIFFLSFLFRPTLIYSNSAISYKSSNKLFHHARLLAQYSSGICHKAYSPIYSS